MPIHSDMPMGEKESLQAAARESHALAARALDITTHQDKMMFAKKRQHEIDYLDTLQQNKFFQSLQVQFFKSAFPIGGTILNACIALHDSMTPKQRKELCAIGNTFVSLPFKLISGDMSLKECLQEYVHTFDRFTHFIKNNYDIALKAGLLFLKNMLPFGEFLGGAAEKIAKAALPKGAVQPLLRGLSALTKSYDGLTTAIEQAHAPKLSGKPRKTPKRKE